MGSCSTAQRPRALTENMLQNLRNKLPPQTVLYLKNIATSTVPLKLCRQIIRQDARDGVAAKVISADGLDDADQSVVHQDETGVHAAAPDPQHDDVEPIFGVGLSETVREASGSGLADYLLED